MTGTVDIAVPCHVVTLNLVLGPEAGATTLEGLVVRGIVAGRRTVEELAHLFSLPHRVMLDVIHGLWTKGYVSIDFSDGFLELTDAAKDLIAAGGGLEDASTQTEQRQFVFEPLSGCVFVFERSLLRPPPDSLEVPITQGVGADDLPRGELLRAVRATVRHEQRDKGLRSNILDVSFGNPLLSTDGGVRWLAVSGTVQIDPETDRLALNLADASGWNRSARDRLRSQIAALAERSPADPFVTSLRNKAEPASPERTDLGHLADRLAALVAEAPDAEPATMAARNEELTEVAGQISERVHQLSGFRAAATPVAAGEDVTWWRGELIRRARHQLVLSVPTVDYSALNDVFHELEAALARGVTLVFLWGTDPTATLPSKVETALYDLQARHPEQVLLADRSSSTRACVLIQDDERAFVGTRSVLDFDPGSSVLVQAAPDAAGPARCVVDLLLWARRVYPYRSDSRRIAFRHEDFGRTRETAVAAPAPAVMAPDRLPVPAENWEADQVAARAVWAAEWEEVHARLVGAVAALHHGDPIVRTTDDADYGDAVHQALGGTMDRLVVTDDRADRIVCGDLLARRLRARIDAGAVLHLHHPALPAPVSAPGKYDELLADLRRQRTYREGRAAARAVVSDHEVLTGSYSPLGRPTARSVSNPHSGHVGLHILGADFAVAFTRTLGIPDWDTLPTRERAAAASRPVARTADRGAGAAARLPWKILEARARDPLCPPESLRAEIARTLRENPDPGPDWDTWANWLLRDAWRRNAFMEAHLLATRIGRSAVLSPALTTAAVPVEHGPAGELLFFAVDELLQGSPGERAVALVGTIAELLLRGGESGVLAYTELTGGDDAMEGIPPTWSELAELAVAYHQDTLTALPLTLLAGEEEQFSTADRITRQWQELAARAQNFASSRQSFGFASGRYAHETLCAPDGFLHGITTVGLAGGGTASAREELAALFPDRDIRAYIDKIVADMPRLPGPRKRQQIQWSRHLNYADRLAGIVEDARRLILETTGLEDQGSAWRAAPEGHLPLAAFVTAHWNQLFIEAEALGDPHRIPALALLKQLRPLSRSLRESHDHTAA
ncbi:hypothetical protein ACF09L_29530 [Streptomyces sp. NPDC014779]|uniref:hypothetical protein n=1 Tax=unclassified Streptomyces TaxID=2593676 RepID=UPI0036F5BDCD